MSAHRASGLLRRALALHQNGRLEEARALYGQVLVLDPRNFDATHLAGVIALQQQRIPEAVRLLERAGRLNPGDRTCAMRHALALSESGRHEEAEVRLRKLAARAPEWAEVWDNLGAVLQRCGRMDDAVAAFRRAVATDGSFARGWCNLGLALLFSDRAAESLRCQEKALALDSRLALAHQGRAMALQHQHRIAEAVAAYGSALALDPALLDARSFRLTALHYLAGIRPSDLLGEHLAYGRAAGPAAGPAAPGTSRNRPPGGRLRIGFLSPDLHDHPVARFIEPILRHLDRGRFEVVLYHDHPLVDEVSVRLQRQADHWRPTAGRPHRLVAEMIHGDGLDVLVDLAGHTGLNRLPVFARRVAPVQVTYLGYPDTTGLSQMDFRLVDAVTDPVPEADELATERLVRFSSCAWAYAPPEGAPAPSLPAAGRPVTFGCFNNPSKLSDPTLAAWAAILEASPGSRLLLKGTGLETAEVSAWFAGRFRAHRIDPARVEIVGRTRTVAEHLGLYAQVDVALDPFPYNGTTTTCEALWMGVPVVTLRGDRHCGRVGASLLAAIGREGWIAGSVEAYVELAGSVGRDRAGREEWRTGARAEMGRSVLLDHQLQAERFGLALSQAARERARPAAVTEAVA